MGINTSFETQGREIIGKSKQGISDPTGGTNIPSIFLKNLFLNHYYNVVTISSEQSSTSKV